MADLTSHKLDFSKWGAWICSEESWRLAYVLIMFWYFWVPLFWFRQSFYISMLLHVHVVLFSFFRLLCRCIRKYAVPSSGIGFGALVFPANPGIEAKDACEPQWPSSHAQTARCIQPCHAMSQVARLRLSQLPLVSMMMYGQAWPNLRK